MNKTSQTTVLTRRKQKLSALLLIGIIGILSVSNQTIPAAATDTPAIPLETHIFEVEYVAAYIADDHDAAWEDGSFVDHPGEWAFTLTGPDGIRGERSPRFAVNTGDNVPLGLSYSWVLGEPYATFSFTASEQDYYNLEQNVYDELIETHCHPWYEYSYTHPHYQPIPWWPWVIPYPVTHTELRCDQRHSHYEHHVDHYWSSNKRIDYVSSYEITLDPGLPTNTWISQSIEMGDVTHYFRYRLYNANVPMFRSGQIVFEGDEVFFDGTNSIGKYYYSSGIIALWHMNEYSGTTMYDESYNSNDGFVDGAIFEPTPDLFQDYGFGLYFDGTDDFVEVPDSPDFNFDNTFSVSSWIRLQDLSSGGIIGQWGAAGLGGDVFMLYVDDGILRGTLPIPPPEGGLYHLYSDVEIPLNMWTQVAMTYDGMELRLYIDGVSVAQGNIEVELPDSSKSLKLGLEDIFFDQKHYLKGKIDETAIWNKALTPEEILAQSGHAEHTLGPISKILKIGGAEIIEFSWDFDGDGFYDYAETPDYAPDGSFDGKTSFVYLDDGVYSVSFRVVDEFGATYIEMISVIVLKNDNTPKGTDVEVSDTDAGVTMTFSEVTEGGITTITVNDQGPPISTEFQLYLGLYYEFTTTAAYTGPITICINYDEFDPPDPEREANLKLMQYDEAAEDFIDITTSHNTETNIICGVTDHLSNFGLMYDSTPPEIISISGPLDPVAIDSDYETTGIFTDPDDSDTHTAIWDWGDGIHSVGTINQTTDTVTGFHIYFEPGVYTITLTVVDSFKESDTATWSQFVVIYDPSTGFVTGGGWIDSPEGAYSADPDLSGKSNFGFIAKYKKAA